MSYSYVSTTQMQRNPKSLFNSKDPQIVMSNNQPQGVFLPIDVAKKILNFSISVNQDIELQPLPKDQVSDKMLQKIQGVKMMPESDFVNL